MSDNVIAGRASDINEDGTLVGCYLVSTVGVRFDDRVTVSHRDASNPATAARRIQFDGILYPLETMGMVGFHLHAHYGVNQVEPLDIESVPEPLPVGDEMRMSKEDQDRIQTIKDRMGKKPAVIVQRSHFAGDNGDIIVGSSWAP